MQTNSPCTGANTGIAIKSIAKSMTATISFVIPFTFYHPTI
jgi:hypothetical protein